MATAKNTAAKSDKSAKPAVDKKSGGKVHQLPKGTVEPMADAEVQKLNDTPAPSEVMDAMPTPQPAKMPTNGKKNSTSRVPAVSTDIFNSTLTLNFSNGKELAIDLNKLAPAIQLQAGLHGLKQKLVDAAAIARDTTTGKEASIDDKYLAVKAVYDRLTSADAPSWNAIREGGNGASHTGGLFLRAMCAITRKTPEVMKAELDKMTKEQLSALKKNPRIIQKMADLQLADIGDNVDSDSLLDSLANTGE